MQGRGLKPTWSNQPPITKEVAPYAGAWIETLKARFTFSIASSPLMQGRGLKQGLVGEVLRGKNVAPYAGAWIETFHSGHSD